MVETTERTLPLIVYSKGPVSEEPITNYRGGQPIRRSIASAPSRTYCPPMHEKAGMLYADYVLNLESVLPGPRPTPTPSPRGGVWAIPAMTDRLWKDRDLRTWIGDSPVHLLWSLLTDREGVFIAIETHAAAWASHKGSDIAKTGMGPFTNPSVNGIAIATGTTAMVSLVRNILK